MNNTELLREIRAAIDLIAAPMRPDGTWNRDRATCHKLALKALAHIDAALAQAEAMDSVPVNLSDIEQYRMQMAGISTAALGYWKEGDSIHPDYDTPALRDVAKLYAKYAAPAVPDAADWGANMRNALDAARYRWLRDESWAGYSLGKGFPHVFTEDGAGNRKAMLAEAALDAAVDAAMLAAAPEMK